MDITKSDISVVQPLTKLNIKPEDITKKFDNLKSNKASGLDQISTNTLKMLDDKVGEEFYSRKQ